MDDKMESTKPFYLPPIMCYGGSLTTLYDLYHIFEWVTLHIPISKELGRATYFIDVFPLYPRYSGLYLSKRA